MSGREIARHLAMWGQKKPDVRHGREENGDNRYQSVATGEFRRSFMLPEDVHREKIPRRSPMAYRPE
jgi:hypothetical protein